MADFDFASHYHFAAMILFPLALFGFTCNLVIFLRVMPSLNNSFGMLTLSQAVADCAHQGIFVFYFAPCLFLRYYEVYSWSEQFGFALILIYEICGMSHVCISINRFTAVYSPFAYSHLFSKSNTRRLILCYWIIAAVSTTYMLKIVDCSFYLPQGLWIFIFKDTPSCNLVQWSVRRSDICGNTAFCWQRAKANSRRDLTRALSLSRAISPFPWPLSLLSATPCRMPCGKSCSFMAFYMFSFLWYGDFIKYVIYVAIVAFLDCCSILRLHYINVRYANGAQDVGLNLRRSRQMNLVYLVKQISPSHFSRSHAALQGIFFISELITYFLLSPYARNKWEAFLLTTMSWCMVHGMDGFIVLVCNRDFRRQIKKTLFSPESNHVGSVSIRSGHSPNTRRRTNNSDHDGTNI